MHVVVIYSYMQLIGRAGRSGQQSTSVLFYSTVEAKNSSDHYLKSLCNDSENCRRCNLLQALGKDECSTVSKNLCCDVCQPTCPYTDLTLPFSTLPTKKRRPRLQPVSAEDQKTLESKLLVERDTVIASNPALKMLPKSVVCPISTIKELCSRSKSINCAQDIYAFAGVRPELCTPFLNVIIGVSPPQKRLKI